MAHGSRRARNQEWRCCRRPTAIYPTDKVVSRVSEVDTRSWWLAVSTEADEYPLLDAATKQRLVKAYQTEKT
jgi:hypothetical protein